VSTGLEQPPLLHLVQVEGQHPVAEVRGAAGLAQAPVYLVNGKSGRELEYRIRIVARALHGSPFDEEVVSVQGNAVGYFGQKKSAIV
jgi:hypothetical protein